METRNETTKTAQWVSAMEAAGKDGLKAEKITDTLYAVRSTSKATCSKHLVRLDSHGKISECANCPGWEHFQAGHSRPCKHAGAVARRLLRERHITVEVPVFAGASSLEDYSLPESGASKHSIFRVAA